MSYHNLSQYPRIHLKKSRNARKYVGISCHDTNVPCLLGTNYCAPDRNAMCKQVGVRSTNSMSPTRSNFDLISENEKYIISKSAKLSSAEISGTGLPRQNEIS
jgi:hypothetical protein